MENEKGTESGIEGFEREAGDRAGAGQAEGLGLRRVSAVKKAQEVETSEHALEDIRNWIVEGNGKFASIIEAIRASSDEEKQAELKRKLPGVMFSGTFAKRSSKELIQHSGLICMDFDYVDQPDQVIDSMRFDPHLALAFISPRGNGVKAVFCIPQDCNHREAFETVRDYCATMYDLEADESGKDVSRLCFLSVDPEAHYAPDAVPLRVAPKLNRNFTGIDQSGNGRDATHAPKVGAPKNSEKCDANKGDRIGDRYEASGDIWNRSADLLRSAGWKIGRSGGDRTFCTRPGKERGVSGTLFSDGGFYCFSDQASPLEPSQGYSAFALFTTLEHGGDFKEAALALVEEFGEPAGPSINGRDFYGKGGDPFQTDELPEDAPLNERMQAVISKLPKWTSAADIPDDIHKRLLIKYPVLIDGILKQGTKMVLGGGSKTYKTWTLLDLAIAAAGGHTWLGKQVVSTGKKVIYINLEVLDEEFQGRIKDVCQAKGVEKPANLHPWSLRGVCNDLRVMLAAIKEWCRNDEIALIVVDPIYKALGDRDENSAGDMNALMNEVEAICEETRAAVVFAAHFSKGNQSEKSAMDRISGSGVFGRDPDAILTLTPHEEDSCFSVESSLRSFAPMDPFVVELEFPLFKARHDLDARKLKKGNQKISDGMILEILKREPAGMTVNDLVDSLLANDCEASEKTIRNRISGLKKAGKIHQGAMNHYFVTQSK